MLPSRAFRWPCLIMLCSLCALSLCVQAAPPIQASDEQLKRAGVRFAAVGAASRGQLLLRLPGSAVFPANGLQVISAPAAGIVQAVLVQPLQQVQSGAALLRLYSPQLLEWQRLYLQEQSRAMLATDKFKRDQALFDEGIVARSRLEESKSNLVQAQAALQEQRQVLRLAGLSDAALSRLKTPEGLSAELDLRAPGAGSVAEQLVQPGQRVEAGAPLLKLARKIDLQLELQAGRPEAERINVGDAVRVAGCPHPGRVLAKGALVNPASQALAVRASLPGSGACLRPNQHVEAEIVLPAPAEAAAGVHSVPAAALLRHEGRDYVLLREAGGARPVEVLPLSRQGEQLLVRGQIPSGASVAVQGMSALKGLWMGMGQEGEHN